MGVLRAALMVLCLAFTALATRSRFLDGGCNVAEVQSGTSGSLSYNFPPLDPSTINCNIGLRCNQTIQPGFLSGRTWYLTQDKAYYGRGYNPWHFQTFHIECPPNHTLYLRAISLNLAQNENIVVNTSRFGSQVITPGSDINQVFGRNGAFILDGRADVDFCSDGNFTASGFVMRATCIDMITNYNVDGCVSYEYWLRWDPMFVSRIEGMFDPVPTTVVPHKRSAEEAAEMYENMRDKLSKLTSSKTEFEENLKLTKSMKRVKRGIRERFSFVEETDITYEDDVLEFVFPNSTIRRVIVHCLYAFNPLYGTRIYTHNATRQAGDQTGSTRLRFTGPGNIDVIPSRNGIRTGYLNWTPPQPFDEFLERGIDDQANIANDIYQYIHGQWLDSYPVIDPLQIESLDPKPFPLNNANANFPQFRRKDEFGVIFPDIANGSKCFNAIRLDAAPLRNATIDEDILYFCSFFKLACDPLLRVACNEIMFLLSDDVDPAIPTMPMMRGGGGDR